MTARQRKRKKQSRLMVVAIAHSFDLEIALFEKQFEDFLITTEMARRASVFPAIGVPGEFQIVERAGGAAVLLSSLRDAAAGRVIQESAERHIERLKGEL